MKKRGVEKVLRVDDLQQISGSALTGLLPPKNEVEATIGRERYAQPDATPPTSDALRLRNPKDVP